MSARQSNTELESDDDYTDPSAIILPHIETDEDILAGYDLEELAVFVPVFLLGAIAVLSFLGDNFVIAGLFAVPAVGGGLLALYLSLSATWYAPPRERFRDWLAYLRSRQSIPWGHEQAVGAVHGVRAIQPDGSVKCRDGRYALALPIAGTNGDHIDSGTVAQLVGGLRTGVNIDLQHDWFAYYTTTREASNEEHATAREDRILETDADTDLTPYQEMVILDGAEWLRDSDADWDANEWHDYIEIQVFPHEYDTTQEELDAATDDSENEDVNTMSAVGRAIGGLVSRGRALNLPEDDEGGVRTPEDVLSDRVERVRNAVGNIEGVQVGEPTPAMSADLLAEYWTGGGHVTGDDLERLVAPERQTIGEFTPTERLLTPDLYDNVGTTMLIDDTLARTYWISDWPMEPESLFLRDLYTLNGVDIDVRIIGQPEDKQDVINELEIIIARARGEEQRREDEQEVSSLAIVDDIDALERAYHCLQQTNAQSRRLSAYVTVRAETRNGLKKACTTVKQTLESYPASCTPVAHGTRQKEAFASCAPFAPNVFEQNTWTDKCHRALSGAFGTMFPFIRTALYEPDGIRWGRNTQTGNMLWSDPFQRGSSPHLITLGKSRGGKTYGVSQAVAEWWLADKDRTLLLCDTQGGFDGVTELLNGDHIIVDSSNGVNPFHIEQSEEHATTLGHKIDEVTEFIAGILRAQGIDPGPYRPTIQLAVQKTYARHDITSDSLPEDADCPTIGDFLETLDLMVESPEQFSHTEHEAVAQRRRDRVSDLLEKLTGFMESGKYSHLVDETKPGITPDTRMAYLDLRHFDDATDAEKSVHLHLMLSQVSQLIKRTPGKTIFVIDEAHLLLHSDEMLAYLQAATREWARYEAAMWFVSQSPQEFVRRSSGTGAGQENHREVILEQCSTTQIYYCGDRIKPKTLADFGVFPGLVETARQRLTPGQAGKGYSECLLHFDDENGWLRTHVEAPPLLDIVLSYKWHKHGDFIEYLRERAGDEIAALAAESRGDLAAEALRESEASDLTATQTTDALRANGHDIVTDVDNDTNESVREEVDDGAA